MRSLASYKSFELENGKTNAGHSQVRLGPPDELPIECADGKPLDSSYKLPPGSPDGLRFGCPERAVCYSTTPD